KRDGLRGVLRGAAHGVQQRRRLRVQRQLGETLPRERESAIALDGLVEVVERALELRAAQMRQAAEIRAIGVQVARRAVRDIRGHRVYADRLQQLETERIERFAH